MRLKSPRRGKVKKHYRRKFKDSLAEWVGVLFNHSWRTRGEGYEFKVSDFKGRTSYVSRPMEALAALEKEGDVKPNKKIPSCPGVYYSLECNEWQLIGIVDYVPTIVMQGSLPDVLEYFEEISSNLKGDR